MGPCRGPVRWGNVGDDKEGHKKDSSPPKKVRKFRNEIWKMSIGKYQLVKTVWETLIVKAVWETLIAKTVWEYK